MLHLAEAMKLVQQAIANQHAQLAAKSSIACSVMITSMASCNVQVSGANKAVVKEPVGRDEQNELVFVALLSKDESCNALHRTTLGNCRQQE